MSSKNANMLLLLLNVALVAISLIDPVGAGLYITYVLCALSAVVSLGSFIYRAVIDFNAVKKFLISTIVLVIFGYIFYAMTEAKPTMGLVNDTVKEIADEKTTQFTGGILGLSGVLLVVSLVLLVIAEIRAVFSR